MRTIKYPPTCIAEAGGQVDACPVIVGSASMVGGDGARNPLAHPHLEPVDTQVWRSGVIEPDTPSSPTS